MERGAAKPPQPFRVYTLCRRALKTASTQLCTMERSRAETRRPLLNEVKSTVELFNCFANDTCVHFVAVRKAKCGVFLQCRPNPPPILLARARDRMPRHLLPHQ